MYELGFRLDETGLVPFLEDTMKILIPTIGSRGDIQPYIALALGLQDAGHEVTFATHPCWGELIESYGIPFSPIGPNIDIGEETAKIRRRSPNWMLGFMRVMNFAFAMVEQSHVDVLELARDTDLMVISHTSAGSMEAYELKLPNVSVTLQPQGIPANDPKAPTIQRALMKVIGAGMGLLMTRPFNQMRKRAGLPPMGNTGITSPVLNLIPLSPNVFPRSPFWEARHVMTGFWRTPSPEKWNPPADLLEFLAAGKPPVVVSLGAMALSGEDAMEAAHITLAALNATGERAVIQGWDEPMTKLEIPDTVFHAGSLPHEWLLPRASAIVHHGGFGTTASGLGAGIPSFVIPHIIDQFIWGQLVEKLGVGPKPIARNKLTVDNMVNALIQMQDLAMRGKAAVLGEKIRSEPDGVDLAVKLIEESAHQQGFREQRERVAVPA
jgi:sterol 3beta-glucosyltransferase